ncbi:MAG: glycerol kinase GlpK [Candidatus Nanopelagicaceae bacterium]
MRYIGSLDQGTSSTRFMIFDETGALVSQHQLEHRQILPAAGWVDHDAEEIWQRSTEVIETALKVAGLEGNDLSGIGITNQRETTVLWSRSSGKPLGNAIVWQDTRTTPILEGLSEHQKERLVTKSGLAIAPYFSASKIAWLLREHASNHDIADLMVGTIDSWLIYKLTGGKVHATDVTNASRTMVMDLETLDWDDELLSFFKIPRSILPSIKPSISRFGTTDPSGPLKAEVPIAGVLGDQQAAMVGQACFDRGESKTTYGTGNFALLNTGEEIVRSRHGLLTTLCYQFEGKPAVYALEGSVAVTGSAVQWLRDQLGIITSASEIESLAATVADNGGVYFVPAFSGLFAPYWRSDARGVIVGLTRAATKAHIARATLEAIAYQTRDVLDAMVQDSGVALTEMRVDGGITANSLCMQIQADVMQIEVSRPAINETTALGASFAAGLTVGIWKDVAELRAQWKESARWEPVKGSPLASEGHRTWKRAIERTLDWQ